MGRPGIRTAFYVVTTVVYLALMFILVPQYSYMGAALAFLGFAVIKSALSFVRVRILHEKGRGARASEAVYLFTFLLFYKAVVIEVFRE